MVGVGGDARGKPYAARAENIRRYTDGRFNPSGLVQNPKALQEETTEAPVPLPDATPQADVALLLHLDDLNPEMLPLDGAHVRRVGACSRIPEGASARAVCGGGQSGGYGRRAGAGRSAFRLSRWAGDGGLGGGPPGASGVGGGRPVRLGPTPLPAPQLGQPELAARHPRLL